MADKSSVQLTSGNLWANIWQMSWPMVLVMLFNFLVGMTDVYVAGFLGAEIQAVVGFVGQLYLFIVIVANALSVGTVALVSRAVGSGSSEEARTVAEQSLLFGLLCSLGLTAAGLLLRDWIIALAGFPPGTGHIARDFFAIFAFSLAPTYMMIISNAIFRAGGEVRSTLVAMSLSSIVNIMLNVLLVRGFLSFGGMGYRGIAVATAFAMTAGAGISVFLLRRGRWHDLFSTGWSLSPATIKRILDLSWPSAVLQVSWTAGSIVLYNILGRIEGVSITAMAALTNGLRIEAVIYLPAFALHMAAAVLTGQNLGTGEPERAEKIAMKIALAGILFVGLMALPVFIRPELFASLVARDEAVLTETGRYLRIMMVSEPFMAAGAVLGGCLQGAGDTRGAMMVILGAMWVLRLPLAYVLALTAGYGPAGVWSAMVLSMCFYGIAMTLRFRQGRWKTLRP